MAKKCSISFSSTPAPRPKKSNKRLAGASDTCSAITPTAHNRQATASGVQPSRNNADSNNSDVSDDSGDTDSNEFDNEWNPQVRNITQWLASNKRSRQEEEANKILDQSMDSNEDKEQEQESNIEQVKENTSVSLSLFASCRWTWNYLKR